MLKGYVTRDDTTLAAREANLVPRFFRGKDIGFGEDDSSSGEDDDSDDEIAFENEDDNVSIAASVNLSMANVSYSRTNPNARNTDAANVSENEVRVTPSPTPRPQNQPLKLSKSRTYWNRYKSFVNSPRVHFINEAIFNTIFLIIFSYMMLCKFYYYERIDEDFMQSHNGSIFLNTSTQHMTEKEIRIVRMPTYIEYLLIYWIFSFIFEEARQVSRPQCFLRQLFKCSFAILFVFFIQVFL